MKATAPLSSKELLANSSLMDFERHAPFGAVGKKRVLTIPWQEVHPQIRWLKGDRMSDRCMLPRIIFDYLLVFFLDGSGTYMIGREEIEVQKRLLLLVPPFTFNSFLMQGSHFFTSVHFDWKPNFPATSLLSGRQPYQVRFPSNVQIPRRQVLAVGDPLVIQLQQLLEAWQEQTEVARLYANILLAKILVTLLKRAEQKKSTSSENHMHTDQKRVEIALTLMQEKLADDLSLETIARTTGLSVGHFSYIFHKWTGHSPVEHLIMLRIQRAKELLEKVHLTIKEISNRCGFKDPSYFSKIFMRFNGVAPSQYRELILAQRGI